MFNKKTCHAARLTGLVLAVLFSGLVAPSPALAADDWGDIATISGTLGANANRLCLGEGLRAGEIGCPSYAPYITGAGRVGIGTDSPQGRIDVSGTVGRFIVDTTGNLVNLTGTNSLLGVAGIISASNIYVTGTSAGTGEVSGTYLYGRFASFTTVTAGAFVGDGSGLTGISAGSDRITSGTTNVTVNSTTGVVSITNNNVTGAYFDSTSRLVARGISLTENQASFTTVYANNRMAVGTGWVSGNRELYVSSSMRLSPNGGTNWMDMYMTTIGDAVIETNGNGIFLGLYTGAGTGFLRNGGIQVDSSNNSVFSGTGKIGIGMSRTAIWTTINPSTSLHVSGTLLATSWTGINFGNYANVTPTAPLEVSGTISATALVVNGVAITGSGGASNVISSGTTSVTTFANGIISFSTGGTTPSYMDTAGRFVLPGISATSNMSSFTTVYASGKVGIGAATPSATLHLGASGAVLAVGPSNGTQRVELSRNDLSFYRDNGPSYINNKATGSSLIFTVSNSNMMQVTTGGVYITSPNSNVNTPQTTLQVSGTIRMADGGEACDSNRAGAIKWNGTQFQVCYGSGGWALLSSAAVSGTGGPESLALNDLTDVSTSASAYNLIAGTVAGANSGVTYTTAVGIGALVAAGNTGYMNSAFGAQTLPTNTTGYRNVAIGARALRSLTTGYNNTFVGTSSGEQITTGNANTAVGELAMYAALSASNNVAIGKEALMNSTVGGANVAIGQSAFLNNNSSNAVAIGYQAGQGISPSTVVTDSVFIGAQSGMRATSAERNVFVGTGAGQYVTSGDDNILIGYNVSTPLVTSSNYLNIGNSIYGDMASAASAVGGAAKVGINFVTPSVALEVSGTVSATALYVGGVAITGSGGGDRITSATSGVIANGPTMGGYISLTNGVTTAAWGYLGVSASYLPVLNVGAISATTNQSSFTTVYASGKVGIAMNAPAAVLDVSNTNINAYPGASAMVQRWSNGGARSMRLYQPSGSSDPFIFATNNAYSFVVDTTTTLTVMALGSTGGVSINQAGEPSTTLDVSGTLRLGNAGEACDSFRAGGIRWNGTEFQTCFGSGGWATLSSAAISGTLGSSGGGDRIVSDTSGVIANGPTMGGYISLTDGVATTWGYLGTSATYLPRINMAAISATTNQSSFTTVYASDNVGIGIAPSYTAQLYVSGTAAANTLKLAYTPGIYPVSFGASSSSNSYMKLVSGGNFVIQNSGGSTVGNINTGFLSMAYGLAAGYGVGVIPTNSTTLMISGTIRMSDGGETCDANRAGAIKWNGTQFQTCFGSGGWATLSSAAISGTLGSSANWYGLTSIPTQVAAVSNSGAITLSGISLTTNQASVTTLYASGPVSTTSTLKLGGVTGDCASTADNGRMVFNAGTSRLQLCIYR